MGLRAQDLGFQFEVVGLRTVSVFGMPRVEGEGIRKFGVHGLRRQDSEFRGYRFQGKVSKIQAWDDRI